MGPIGCPETSVKHYEYSLRDTQKGAVIRLVEVWRRVCKSPVICQRNVCLFVRSFVRLFVCSFVCSFVLSFVCLFVRSFVRLFVSGANLK